MAINQAYEDKMRFPQAPSVLYIYGLAGACKSFVGEVIHRETGWPLYEADKDFTPPMLQAVAEKKPFIPEGT